MTDTDQTDKDNPTMTDPTPPDTGEVDLTGTPAAGWVFVLRQIKAKRAELDEAEKQARAEIQKTLGNAVDGLLDGRPVVRWHHTAAPRRFDTKGFRKAHPDLAEQFTTIGEPGRRFEVLDTKDGAQ